MLALGRLLGVTFGSPPGPAPAADAAAAGCCRGTAGGGGSSEQPRIPAVSSAPSPSPSPTYYCPPAKIVDEFGYKHVEYQNVV